MESLLKYVQDEFVTKKDLPDFSAGDTITVYYEIKEGNKTRTQYYRGVVLQRRGTGSSETFTIRKMSGTIGVERIFPVNMPALQKLRSIKEVKCVEQGSFISEVLPVKKPELKKKESKPVNNTAGELARFLSGSDHLDILFKGSVLKEIRNGAFY